MAHPFPQIILIPGEWAGQHVEQEILACIWLVKWSWTSLRAVAGWSADSSSNCSELPYWQPKGGPTGLPTVARQPLMHRPNVPQQ